MQPQVCRLGASPCTVSRMILVKEQPAMGTLPRASSSNTMPNDQMSAAESVLCLTVSSLVPQSHLERGDGAMSSHARLVACHPC